MKRKRRREWGGEEREEMVFRTRICLSGTHSDYVLPPKCLSTHEPINEVGTAWSVHHSTLSPDGEQAVSTWILRDIPYSNLHSLLSENQWHQELKANLVSVATAYYLHRGSLKPSIELQFFILRIKRDRPESPKRMTYLKLGRGSGMGLTAEGLSECTL